jgi:flagella basal body P-ring formation protein FlgA
MSMRWLMACALAGCSFGVRAESVPAWVQTAQGELLQRLQDAHPQVTSWTLVPMLSDRQRTELADSDMQIDTVKLGRRSALQVTSMQNDRRTRQTVWFDVSGLQPALRVDAGVKRNELIRVESMRADEHAAWDPTCSIVSPTQPPRGMRARKALRTGDLLCAEDIEPKPPVSRGERVVVHSSAGLVTVVVSGIAEADGNIGDRLQVRNPSSGELYVASVAAEGEVVVRQ